MKPHSSRMGVGASSILLILVVLSLTLFGVLSLVQARSDAALTEHTALSVTAFYDADARAQRVLALVDDALASGALPTVVDGVTQQGEGVYAFSIGSFDGHSLDVRLDVSGEACRVTSYRYLSAEEWVGEGAETLWQGQ